MKKSAILRPVSQKAYARFVERITLVVTDASKREAMLAALDSYLDGNRDTYDCNLTPDCVMVFGMLRFEIDLAIARSAKARTRVRERRASVNPGIREVAKSSVNNCQKKASANGNIKAEPTPADDGQHEDTLRLPRRIRRAVDRKARAKTRWGKLG